MIGQGAKNLWQRFMATAGELSETVTGDRIQARLDQDLRMTDLELKRARDRADEAKARRIHAQQQASQARDQQLAMEDVAAKFLRGRRKKTALLAATDAAGHASDAHAWSQKAESAQSDEKMALAIVEGLQRQMALLKQQMHTLKAVANLQRTQAALTSVSGEGEPDTALAAARRMKQTKIKTAKTGNQTTNNPAPETAQEILERLKGDQNKRGNPIKRSKQ